MPLHAYTFSSEDCWLQSVYPSIHHVSFALPPPSIPTPISPGGRISAGQPRSSARCPRNSDMQFTWWNKCSQAHGAGPWPMRSARFQKHGPYPAQGRGSIAACYLDNQRTHSTVFMKCVPADRKRKEGIYHQRSQSPATCLHSSRASLLNTELFCLLKIPMLSRQAFITWSTLTSFTYFYKLWKSTWCRLSMHISVQLWLPELIWLRLLASTDLLV